jgi:hypothetical protein
MRGRGQSFHFSREKKQSRIIDHSNFAKIQKTFQK